MAQKNIGTPGRTENGKFIDVRGGGEFIGYVIALVVIIVVVVGGIALFGHP